MIKQIFKKHPASVNETYITHFKMAMGFAFSMIFASFKLFIHAFIPCLFQDAGSDTAEKLYNSMIVNRKRKYQELETNK